jgi:hypothetical protein
MLRSRILVLTVVSLLLVGCGDSSPTVPLTPSAVGSEPASAPTSTHIPTIQSEPSVTPTLTSTPSMVQSEPSSTLTPTPTVASVLGGATETPTPPQPSGGEVEVRIPYYIVMGNEAPTDIPECVNSIPFSMTRDGTRVMIEGEGRIDCHFESTGTPITFHVLFEFDASLNGELMPPTPEKPSGWLDAYLAIEGSIAQYYTNYPPEATNPCPESDRCRTPISDVIPLPFSYEEGSTITTPWTFILHLR